MNADKMKRIRAAVTKHHAGHEQTDDAAILMLWQTLNTETQKKYLAAVDGAAEGKKGSKAE